MDNELSTSTATAEQGQAPAAKAPAVLRVRAGSDRLGPGGTPVRCFSVTLDKPAGEDLGIVAAAVDPKDPRRKIPTPGSPHPILAGFAARCPEIHAVGLRYKGGGMITADSGFYNVVVRYERRRAGP